VKKFLVVTVLVSVVAFLMCVLFRKDTSIQDSDSLTGLNDYISDDGEETIIGI